jgi:hypothetical protein
MYFEMKMYSDLKGRQIQHKIYHLDEGEKAPENEFFGSFTIAAETPIGPVQKQVLFPIPAVDLKAAFGMFDIVAKVEAQKASDELKVEVRERMQQMQQQIAMPGGVDISKIPLPGKGKKIITG